MTTSNIDDSVPAEPMPTKRSLRLQLSEQMDGHHWQEARVEGKLAERVRRTPFYRKARSVFVSLHPLLNQTCLNILTDGKTLILPSPQLQAGFRCLAADSIPMPKRPAALRQLSGKNAIAPKIQYGQGPPGKIDLLLTASWLAGKDGSMLGDGHGHFDLQVAILMALGWLTSNAAVVTFIADDRFLRPSPIEPTDVLAHHVISPTRSIETSHEHPQRLEIVWGKLTEKQIRRNDALYFLQKRHQIIFKQ